MIKLKTLKLNNWRSWRELELEGLDTLGLTLLLGSNGSGKSSIRQAIEYLLLDKTSDLIPLEELTFNKKGDCRISCQLEKDGDEIEIIKYREHSGSGNETVFRVNGNDGLTHTDRRETQKEILKYLGIDRETIFISTIFSQYSPSFVEAKEAERKAILYDFLKLSKYEHFNKTANKTVKLFMAVIKETEKEIESKKRLLFETQESLREIKSKQQSWESDNAEEIRRLKRKRSDLTKDAESLGKIENLVERLLEEYTDVDRPRMTKLDLTIHRMRDKVHILSETEKALIKTINDTVECMCPVLKEGCDRLQDAHTVPLSQKAIRINRLRMALIKGHNKLKDQHSVLQQKVHKNDRVEERMKNLTNERREIEEKKRLFDSLGDQIEKLEGKSNPLDGLSDKYKSRVREIQQEIESLEKTIAESSGNIEYYKYWEKAFSKQGIPNLKIETVLGEIEDEINTNLSAMYPLASVHLAAQQAIKSGEMREKIAYKIAHPDVGLRDYLSYSGGERQRIKVADIFAFSNLLNKFDFLFLDEVLELSLDQVGIEQIVAFLREKAQELGTVFVVSHNSHVQDDFDNIIKVEKRDGRSSISS